MLTARNHGLLKRFLPSAGSGIPEIGLSFAPNVKLSNEKVSFFGSWDSTNKDGKRALFVGIQATHTKDELICGDDLILDGLQHRFVYGEVSESDQVPRLNFFRMIASTGLREVIKLTLEDSLLSSDLSIIANPNEGLRWITNLLDKNPWGEGTGFPPSIVVINEAETCSSAAVATATNSKAASGTSSTRPLLSSLSSKKFNGGARPPTPPREDSQSYSRQEKMRVQKR